MAIIPTFGLGSFFQIAILLLNAVCILSEDRFLARIGLSARNHDPAFGAGPGGDQSFKFKLMNMIASVRSLTRAPLILVNILVIFYEVILG
ncbi:Yos1-like protein [Pestalotiopsis sp. NC0098]|nr:Yos1-like protein [Pestalotiopsis sp. NC0098]